MNKLNSKVERAAGLLQLTVYFVAICRHIKDISEMKTCIINYW